MKWTAQRDHPYRGAKSYKMIQSVDLGKGDWLAYSPVGWGGGHPFIIYGRIGGRDVQVNQIRDSFQIDSASGGNDFYWGAAEFRRGSDARKAAEIAIKARRGRAVRHQGRFNIGTKQRTDRPTIKPAPWPPCPTDATDDYCPLHDETYKQFKPGITYEYAASYLRDYGGRPGEGSTGWFGKKAHHGDVLRTMGVLKTDAWRERHGCCVVDRDELWEHQQDYFVSHADPTDPRSWRWAPEPPPKKDLICLTDKRTGPKCFIGTRRRPTGRVRPPLGGADCRDPRSGKFTTCATGDTRLGPRKKKR